MILKKTLFALCLALTASLHAGDGLWQVSFEQAKNRVFLRVRGNTFGVTFNQRHAWNVAEILFKDRLVGIPSGATGTVIHWDGKAVGTGHGGEVVESFTLTLDGREVPLQQGDTALFKLEDTHEAREVVLSRRSLIGPLRTEVRFVFAAGAEHYTVTKRFEVMEDITPERFAGYAYTFMQMMPEDFTEWMTFRPDGTGLSGHNAPGKNSQPRDPAAEINTPFQALACYAPEWGVGIVYAYPREYEGENHLLHRGGQDNKFRARLFRDSGYEKGEKLEFTMKVFPFESSPEGWAEKARLLSAAK